MNSLFRCLRGEREPPVSLDAKIQVECDCMETVIENKSGYPGRRRVLGYPLNGARRYNFDFLTHDNGKTYIATFRAMYRGEVTGHDSKPIPQEVFTEFRIIKKRKNGNVYGILLDTGGRDLDPFLNEFTKEELVMLGIEK